MAKKLKVSTIIYSILLVIFTIIFSGGVAIYALGMENGFTRKMSRTFPYPASVMNFKSFVWYGVMRENVDSIQKFYESQSQDFSKFGLRVDFSTEDGKKRLSIRERQLLNKMTEDLVIADLAKKNGIKISDEAVNQKVKRLLEENANQESVEEKLERLYGWTLVEFEQKVAKPEIYREEMAKFYRKKSDNKKPKEKIEKALKAIKTGKNFMDAAREFSEGRTAESGGELGWFKKEQMIPELAEMAFSLKPGEMSGVLESEIGFHIIKLEDKKTENEEESVRISQVFARKKNFSDWLKEEMANYKIYIPLKKYYWDGNEKRVRFSDQKMEEYENKISENFQGDVSVGF